MLTKGWRPVAHYYIIDHAIMAAQGIGEGEMLERDVTVMFKRVFDDLPVYTLRDNTASGWPDKLIQLGTRVALAELKHTIVNTHNYFRLNEFRSDQAAHFAKWQKANGFCFLFIGLSNTANQKIGYGALTVLEWKQWLDVNKLQYEVEDLDVFSEQTITLRKWFNGWTQRW